MCMAPKAAKLPPVPTIATADTAAAPVAPMQSPEADGTKDSTGALRKSRTGRKGLKIDLTSGSGGGTGLNIPL